MTDYTWANPLSGDWNVTEYWLPHTGTVPGANDTATVSGYENTLLKVTKDHTVDNLTVDNQNAVLTDFGPYASLEVGNVLALDAGTIDLDHWGSLNLEGTVGLNGGSLFLNTDGQVSLAGTVYQTGTDVQLGRNSEIYIDFGRWILETDAGISQTGPASIINTGVFEKTGGTGTSRVAGGFDNAGYIEVSSGKLTFLSDVQGSGMAEIFDQATLQFDRAVDCTVEFTGYGQTLISRDPLGFTAEIEDFNPGDTVKLLGVWNEVSSEYSNGLTTLTLQNSHPGGTHEFQFMGDVTGIMVHPGAMTAITV